MKATNKFRNLFLMAALGTSLTVVTSSCSKDDPAPAPTPNVVALAQTDSTLSLLVTLASKAGLADYLSNTNNITVFAPTNAAFRAAGYTDAVINNLTNAQAAAGFDAVLKYHVLAIRANSTAVPASDTLKTVNTKNIYASKNANGVFVNGIRVSTADLNASNGVVHKIDGVLIPPTQTIAQIVTSNADFSTLLAALGVAQENLVTALSGPGKFTVFAPNNDAFATSGITTLPPQAQAATIIKGHVIATNVFASDLINNATAPTLNASQTLTITLPPAVKITGSANAASGITTANIVATNGVIHVINRVLQ